LDEQGARELVARVETLLGEVEALADPVAREKASELVQSLVDLYGEALTRIVATLGDGEAEGLAEDELVSHLLLLHDVHPVPLVERVQGALEEVRPYLDSHGGGVELLAVEEGEVRLRLEGSCSGCPSSTMTLKLAIEDAIHKAAPEVEEIKADGVSEPTPAPGLLQLEVSDSLTGGAGANGGPPSGAWVTAGGLPELASGGTVVKAVSGEDVLFTRLAETFYAYGPVCSGCGESLAGAGMRAAELSCPGCGRRFDVQRAGRCLDEPDIHLEPLPLLVDDSGLVKVAVRAGAV
jgi:Fe-S cluster biogenesis protein NfuA/nitrite reductase/ring-hydroxylating ferredoxin subunit